MRLTAREIADQAIRGVIDGDTKWIMDKAKMYYLKLDVELDFNNHTYLNYDKKEGAFIISDKNEIHPFKVMFSDEDIVKMDIQMDYFIKEEVE